MQRVEFDMSASGATDALSVYMASQGLGSGTADSVTQTFLGTDFVQARRTF